MTLFAEVAELAESLAGQGSKLKKRAEIAQAIARVYAAAPAGDHAGRFALYLAGQPFPENDARKLNAGGAVLSSAVKAVAGADDRALAAAYRRHGDLGAAAYDLLSEARGKSRVKASLTLEDMAKAFAALSSARTTASRSALIEGMLRRATALEAKYLIKLMLGDMRIGVKQSLVEEAIAGASKTETEAVRHAVMLEADLSRAVARAFAGTLDKAALQLFHPLGFMLASPVDTPEEAVQRFWEPPAKKNSVVTQAKRSRTKRLPNFDFADLQPVQQEVERDAAEAGLAENVERGEAGKRDELVREGRAGLVFLEDKYDGMRAQVHCGDPAHPGRVGIYSRNREEITAGFPELAEAFARIDEPVILDGEILAWNYARAQALPFALLTQRIGRKRAGNELRAKIPVVFMAFDLLFAQGELLLPHPLTERRARLEALVNKWNPRAGSPLALSHDSGSPTLFTEETPVAREEMRLMLSPAVAVQDAEAIERAYADARARSNEGVILKAGDSAYLPGRRGLAWLKLKRKLATLDVVITGAEFGHGRRAGLLSDYTFAVRNKESRLLNVGKAYSGVTDEEILELTRWLKEHTLEDQGHFRTVEPQIVLEVAFNNIMRSTRHASGFALRFPRILKIRRDKPVSEIDTLARVEDLYQSQPDRPAEGEPSELG